MSGNFSASQYNDAFSPKRLGNWENTAHHPGRFHAPKRHGPTEIIADDRGHLLPHVPRAGLPSPWGNQMAYSWEPTNEVKKVASSNLDTVCTSQPIPNRAAKIEPKLPRFHKQVLKLPKLPAKRPQGVKSAVDPILNRIRERRLPIIWMIGLPTEKILKLRQQFCEELSCALDYAYININDCIEKWKIRQGVRFDESSMVDKENASTTTATVKKQQSHIFPASKTPTVCIPAKISSSLLNLVNEYDKTPDRAALAYASHINIYRQSRQASAVISQPFHFDPTNGEEIQLQLSPGNMIHFDVGQPLTRDKIMELLKFAMVESMPTRGYIIDGIFLEEGDGICFEKMFYAPAVCTYMTESTINNAIDEWNRVRNSKPSAQDLIVDKQIKSKIKLVPPKHARRNKKYSFIEVDKLCRTFETKLIRVLNAEEANEETIHFVYSLVYKHIKSYPNLIDEPRANFFDHTYSEQDDEESDAFLSPINSAIASSRPVQKTNKDPIKDEVQRLVDAQTPVIWILGLTQADTERIRQSFCNMITSQMNFTYINLDHEIPKWYNNEFDDVTNFSIQPNTLTLIQSKVQGISKLVIDGKETLTPETVVELIKYAMILHPSSHGYLIDEFPTSSIEGNLFEQQLYPSTSLVYFLNFSWTTNKLVEPPVEPPQFVRRRQLYSEQMVEQVCDRHGFKAIKIWNAEDLDDEGMVAISNIISECIDASYADGRPASSYETGMGSPSFKNLIIPVETNAALRVSHADNFANKEKVRNHKLKPSSTLHSTGADNTSETIQDNELTPDEADRDSSCNDYPQSDEEIQSQPPSSQQSIEEIFDETNNDLNTDEYEMNHETPQIVLRLAKANNPLAQVHNNKSRNKESGDDLEGTSDEYEDVSRNENKGQNSIAKGHDQFDPAHCDEGGGGDADW